MGVKDVLKNLRRTKDMFLVYGGEDELIVKGYSDTRFQMDKDDFRLQFRFVFCLNRVAVSWESSKQSIAANSTTNAKYITLPDVAV